jgi:RNA polymerase sigma-70 factor (ECF subfamily)
MRDLVSEYGDLLWSLARRFTRSDTESEDAVQDIIVSLWRKAPLYRREVGDEVTFVSMIARRRLIDRFRRDSRRPASAGLPDEATAPPSQELNGEDAAMARSIFETLPDEQQSVLRMSIVYGRTHEVIAAHTGMPLGTVKTHIRRGLSAIREQFTSRQGGTR